MNSDILKIVYQSLAQSEVIDSKLRLKYLRDFSASLPTLICLAFDEHPETDESAMQFIRGNPLADSVYNAAIAFIDNRPCGTTYSSPIVNGKPWFSFSTGNFNRIIPARGFYAWVQRSGFSIPQHAIQAWLAQPSYLDLLDPVVSGGTISLYDLVCMLGKIPTDISATEPLEQEWVLPNGDIQNSIQWFEWGKINSVCQRVYMRAVDDIRHRKLFPDKQPRREGSFHSYEFEPSKFYDWYRQYGFPINPDFEAAIKYHEDGVEKQLAEQSRVSIEQTTSRATLKTERDYQCALAERFIQSGLKSKTKFLDGLSEQDPLICRIGTKQMLARRGAFRLWDGLKLIRQQKRFEATT